MTTNVQTNPRSRKRRRLVGYLCWVVPLLLFISFWGYMAATGRWTPMPSQAEPVYRYAPNDLSAEDTQRIMDDIVHGEFGLPSQAPLELLGVVRSTDKTYLFISVTLRVPSDEAKPIIGPLYIPVAGGSSQKRPFRDYATQRNRQWLDMTFYRLPAEVQSAEIEKVFVPSGEWFYRVSVPPYDYFALTQESTINRFQGSSLFGKPPLFP